MIYISKYFSLLFFGMFFYLSGKGQNTPQDTSAIAQDIFMPTADQTAKKAVAKIMQYTGLTPHFEIIENKNIKSAIAYIKNNKQYIAYNPGFILKLKNLAQTNWAAVSVLAHEIGHHLNGHTLQKKVSLTDELEADRFSGYILYLMGATLQQTKAALTAVSHEVDTIRHPKPEIRLQAIANGWHEAQNIVLKKAFSDSEKMFNDEKVNFTYIVRFKGNSPLYYIDENNRVIWFDNYGKATILGSLEISENEKYKYILEINDVIYGVDKSLQIWNTNNRELVFTVGQLEKYKNE